MCVCVYLKVCDKRDRDIVCVNVCVCGTDATLCVLPLLFVFCVLLCCYMMCCYVMCCYVMCCYVMCCDVMCCDV